MKVKMFHSLLVPVISVFCTIGASYAQSNEYLAFTGYYDETLGEMKIDMDFEQNEEFDFKLSKFKVDLSKEPDNGRFANEPLNTFTVYVEAWRLMNPLENAERSEPIDELYDTFSFKVDPNWSSFWATLKIQYGGLYTLKFYNNSGHFLCDVLVKIW